MAYVGQLTNEQRAAVCARYNAGESSQVLSTEFGISPQAVRALLARRGIERRTRSEAGRQFSCNHAYFASIDTEENAYWLGFLAADGYVSGNALAVSLAITDREHLMRLRQALASDHPVTDYAYPNVAFSRLYVRSDQLTRDLASYGIVQNKTTTLRWPELPLESQRHFLRGYVDGDGGFHVTQTAYPRPNLTFEVTSNQWFLEECQSFLMKQCELGKTRFYYRHTSSPIATLRYCGRRQVARICDFLYDGAAVFLPRKLAAVAPHLNASRNLAERGKSALGGLSSTSLSCQLAAPASQAQAVA